MASIDSILKKAANPFDPASFKPGNFWQEQPGRNPTVDSIHQEILTAIATLLDQVSNDHQTRTLILLGDSGSGKSHLLGRLKHTLNSRAFFVYIGPWADSTYLWRHILRQTVDSLVQVPTGQQESQLLLWLKGLSIFRKKSLLDRFMGDRKGFIRQLRETYKAGIYNANEFFGVLYDLLNPALHLTACDWLRGDDLDEEALQSIRVKTSIDSEAAAQKVLENFGRIAVNTQPIVLCFDNLDGIPRQDGFIDLQALFNVNSTIHNEKLKGFVIIISLITNTWVENAKRIQLSDKARVDQTLTLRPINLMQAEGLWQTRLAPLHIQANPPPPPMYPFAREMLEQSFPGGKTRPRNVLELGRRLFGEYKTGQSTATDPYAAFHLIWLKELQKNQQRLVRIRQLASPELAQMLREALTALGMEEVRSRFLPSPKYFPYSFSFQPPGKSERIGVVWTEEPNATSFFHIMKACQKALEVKLCQRLILIRAEVMPRQTTKGYALFSEIFSQPPHCALVPSLDSVQQLATYYNLLNATHARDLVIAGNTPSPAELMELVRAAQVFQGCELLQDLAILPAKAKANTKASHRKPNPKIPPAVDQNAVRDFICNFVKINSFLGVQTLIQNALTQYPQMTTAELEQIIVSLCQERKIQLLDPHAPFPEQLVCHVPDAPCSKH